MPFVKTGGKILYYAHVPKCGGTSVEDYLSERFGTIAMLDRHFNSREPGTRWTKTSPQHVDAESLEHILPLAFMDAVFTVVRHPVARAESAFHFQVNVEKSIPPDTGFSNWLQGQIDMQAADRFVLDNHMRPQSDFVPEGAAVFHLENGLDALIPWLDDFAGNAEGPRSIGHSNKRKSGGEKSASPPRAKPSDADMAVLREFYAADFERFGYTPETRKPKEARPVLSEEFIRLRDRDLARRSSTAFKLQRKFQRWLNRP